MCSTKDERNGNRDGQEGGKQGVIEGRKKQMEGRKEWRERGRKGEGEGRDGRSDNIWHLEGIGKDERIREEGTIVHLTVLNATYYDINLKIAILSHSQDAHTLIPWKIDVLEQFSMVPRR